MTQRSRTTKSYLPLILLLALVGGIYLFVIYFETEGLEPPPVKKSPSEGVIRLCNCFDNYLAQRKNEAISKENLTISLDEAKICYSKTLRKYEEFIPNLEASFQKNCPEAAAIFDEN